MKGVIAIVSSPDGNVKGVAGDFKKGSPSGFTDRDMQEYRALEKAWRDVFYNHCSDFVSNALLFCQHESRGLSARLRVQGWKETIRDMSIGEEEE